MIVDAHELDHGVRGSRGGGTAVVGPGGSGLGEKDLRVRFCA
jgi:hypothetical protein